MENKNQKNEGSEELKKALQEEAHIVGKTKKEEERLTSQNRAVFYWETPEYRHHEKDKRWYIVAGAILLFFVLIGVLTGSASMAVVFLLLGGVYYITQQQKPRDVHVIISELGIHFAHRFYPYNIIDSFWVLYNPPHVTTLNIKLTKGAMRIISIELADDLSPGDVRDYLLTQIPEREGQEEGIVDALSRKFKL
jgi:hypothetical protein